MSAFGNTLNVKCQLAGKPFLELVFVPICNVDELLFRFSNIMILGECLFNQVTLHVVYHSGTHGYIECSLLGLFELVL
jgi:hypothetical protein